MRIPTSARFRLSSYVLAEGGVLVFDPTRNNFGSVPGAQRQSTGVFAYTTVQNFPRLKHVAPRVEYRGLVYPDFGLAALNTNTGTHTVQPSAGLVPILSGEQPGKKAL